MSLRKKTFLFVPIVLSLSIFVGSAHGDSMLMVGRGGAACSFFLQESSSNHTWGFVYYSWAEGYMSAINVRNTNSNSDINLSVASLQGPQQLEFLKDYCKKNPDQTFAIAVMNLYSELRLRQ